MKPKNFCDCSGPWGFRHLVFFTNHLKLVNSIPEKLLLIWCLSRKVITSIKYEKSRKIHSILNVTTIRQQQECACGEICFPPPLRIYPKSPHPIKPALIFDHKALHWNQLLVQTSQGLDWFLCPNVTSILVTCGQNMG